MQTQEKPLYLLVGIVLASIAIMGLIAQGVAGSLSGLLKLQVAPARLIADFTSIGGIGGAFLNAAIMGTLATLLVRLNGVRLSGPTFAAIFTIVGFSLFGKTPLNTLPIAMGVFLASRYIGKPFKNYLLMALFGTAAGPVVSFAAFESGLPLPLALATALIAGTLVGFLLPSMAMAMLRLHEGFNLYNIGFTVGFLGLFAASLVRGLGPTVQTTLIWNAERHPVLVWSMPLFSLLFLLWGLASDRRSWFSNLKLLLAEGGRLPSDFMESASVGAALINAGLLGLIASGYLALSGAAFNGPTIGAVWTLVGFAAFGKHLKNCLPIALGVLLATLFFGKGLGDPGPILALIFATTLAPLAGEFGFLIGVAAGFTHLFMVEQTGLWHGGMNLYNNGFAGGLTASFFVAIIQWRRANKQNK